MWREMVVNTRGKTHPVEIDCARKGLNSVRALRGSSPFTLRLDIRASKRQVEVLSIASGSNHESESLSSLDIYDAAMTINLRLLIST